MSIKLAAIICFIVTSSALFSQSPRTDAGDAAGARVLDHYAVVSEFHPRTEGRESQTFEYIERVSTDAGYTPNEYRFDNLAGVHAFSRVLEIEIPGVLPDRVIIAVPVDHEPGIPPESDGSFAIATALAALERFSESRPQLTLVFVFLGAERAHGIGEGLGTRLYLDDFFAFDPTAVLYFGYRGIPNQIILETGGGGTVTPLWLLTRVSQALERTEFEYVFLGNRNQMHRTRFAAEPTWIAPYLEAGVPAIEVDGSGRGSGNASDTAAAARALDGFIEAFLAYSADGIPTAWDRHYLFFNRPEGFLVVPEPAVVVVLLVTLGLTLLYGVSFRRRVGRYARSVARNLIMIPVLFLILFGLFAAATALIEIFLALRGFPALWRHAPYAFVVMKVVLAVVLFSLVFQTIKRQLLPKNSTFYSAGAILFFLINLATMLLLSVSFTYFFLWAYVCAFLFSVVRRRRGKILFFALSPLWILFALHHALSFPELSVVEGLLLSRVAGNALIAAITLPFIFMLIRIDFFVRHPVSGRSAFTLKLTTGVGIAAAILLGVYLFNLTPYTPDSPQVVSVRETIDARTNERRLSFESDAPLGRVDFRLGGEERAVTTAGRAVEFELEPRPSPVSIDVSTGTFLGRKRHTIAVESVTGVRTVSVQLRSDDAFLIYDSNFPFTMSNGNTSAEIHIGNSPPNPFTIEVTVPGASRISVEIETTTDRLTEEFSLSRDDVQTVLEVHSFKTIAEL